MAHALSWKMPENELVGPSVPLRIRAPASVCSPQVQADPTARKSRGRVGRAVSKDAALKASCGNGCGGMRRAWRGHTSQRPSARLRPASPAPGRLRTLVSKRRSALLAHNGLART